MAVGQQRSAGAPAILLCQPFGQEYIRCHRLLRTFAGRLAQQGSGSLRFDYAGTGDSEGADEDCCLSGWVDDVSAAHRELIRRANTDRVVWVGVRLGAVAAMLASQRMDVPPSGLVLWEPIGSGKDYLSELSSKHREALAASFTFAQRGLPGGDGREVLGFGLGERMRTELYGLSLQEGIEDGKLPSSVWLMPASPAPYLAVPTAGARHKTLVLETPFEWNAEESLNSALVPADAINRLLNACATFRD